MNADHGRRSTKKSNTAQYLLRQEENEKSMKKNKNNCSTKDTNDGKMTFIVGRVLFEKATNTTKLQIYHSFISKSFISLIASSYDSKQTEKKKHFRRYRREK